MSPRTSIRRAGAFGSRRPRPGGRFETPLASRVIVTLPSIDGDVVEAQPAAIRRPRQLTVTASAREERIVVMPDRRQPHVGQHHAAQREVVVQIVGG